MAGSPALAHANWRQAFRMQIDRELPPRSIQRFHETKSPASRAARGQVSYWRKNERIRNG
jgi:hypothetical protein